MRLYLSSFHLGNRPDRLLELLRGGKRALVVTNADDYKTGAERIASFERERGDLAVLGLEPVELDLRPWFDRPAELRSLLADCDLVWVRGGNSFILRRALRRSGADELLLELLADDRIVYGGYSAGACMMTPSMRGIDLVDDPHQVPPGYDAPVIWECLGVLPYSILPHYRSEHPESGHIEKSVQYLIDHHVPFVALRDGQALVRNGDYDVVVD